MHAGEFGFDADEAGLTGNCFATVSSTRTTCAADGQSGGLGELAPRDERAGRVRERAWGVAWWAVSVSTFSERERARLEGRCWR